jgi:hypothetical protein
LGRSTVRNQLVTRATDLESVIPAILGPVTAMFGAAGRGSTWHGGRMFTTMSVRDFGGIAILLGLLGALMSGQAILIPPLLVLVGVGLRIEAALWAGIRQRRDAQPHADSAGARSSGP